MKTKCKLNGIGVAALMLLLVFPIASSASPILDGTFNLAGTFSVTGLSLIHWQSDDMPPKANQVTVGTSGLSGTFASLAPGGEHVAIDDLHNPPEIVGSSGFAPTPFLNFPSMPAWAALQIDFIPQAPVLNPANNCPGGTGAVGQTCTLAGSPFNLINVSGIGTHPIGTQVGFVFDGVTSDGKSDWTANLTAQFNVPYQTLLGKLFPKTGRPGTVTGTFSATFTVVGTPAVPESSTTGYMLIGCLTLAGVCLRKRLSARSLRAER